MEKEILQQEDREKLQRALKRYRRELAGIVLRLAWRAGLTRKEIHALTWDKVDLNSLLLRLPDREVPLEAETAEALEQWEQRYEKDSEYVALSPRTGARVAEQSLSTLVRNTLNREGLERITLNDLRHDYILRQFQAHDWPYVLRVAVISLSSYRSYLAPEVKKAGAARETEAPPPPPAGPDKPQEGSSSEFRLWRVMQLNRDRPGGIAIWLIQQMGLQVTEIAGLTWDDVDFAAGTLRVNGAELPLTRGAARILREERDRRGSAEDPHVVLSEKARRPVPPQRLSLLIREAMIRGGFEDTTALNIRLGQLRDIDWKVLEKWVGEHGSITPKEAARLLDVTVTPAWQRLQSMERLGYLVHIGHKYYSAEKTPSADGARSAILARAAEHGAIRCSEAAELVNIPPRQAGYLLRRMVKDGELAETEKRGYYALPGGGAE